MNISKKSYSITLGVTIAGNGVDSLVLIWLSEKENRVKISELLTLSSICISAHKT